MRLSERIEQADYDCVSLWQYLEDAGYPVDGNAINKLKAVMQTLLDCERLAKRYEDAPVAIMDTRDALGLCAPTEADFPALYAIQGQRVRIVLDKEGV